MPLGNNSPAVAQQLVRSCNFCLKAQVSAVQPTTSIAIGILKDE